MLQDARIGRRAPRGKIVQSPTKYVTGEQYVAASNPAPTIFWLDKDGEYFVYLPVGMGNIKADSHAKLLEIVGKSDQIDFVYYKEEESDLESYLTPVLPQAGIPANMNITPKQVKVIKGS